MSTTLSGSVTLINVDDGATGATGQQGAQGVSITNVINHYLATSASSGVTPSTSGWTTTVQNMTSTKQYLWNYEEVIGSNGSTLNTTTPCIIGRYGQNGTNGTNGTDGVGITGIVEWYQVSASNSTPPATPSQAGTGYSSTPVATTVDAPYLWNYEVISYTSGSPTITDARVIGTHGATGATGAAGADGQMLYATSSSAASTVEKTATLASGTLTLTEGATVAVTFTYENTASNPTLNIAGTGAKAIYAGGAALTGVYNWNAGDTCVFTYDGTYWRLTNQGIDAANKGICSTAAATAAKEVTCANFRLETGATISVYNTTANTVKNAITLNVNGTGEKRIYASGLATSSSNQVFWATGSFITYTYNGTYWYVSDEPGTYYATCSTVAATAAKVCSSPNSVIRKGTKINVLFVYTNSAASPSLNISSTGTNTIYAKGAALAATSLYNWQAGSTQAFTFDGSHWRMDDDTAKANAAESAKYATDYITKISSNGVFVHLDGMADDTNIAASDAYGVHVDDSVEVIRGGVVMAEFGAGTNGTEIILGDATSKNFFADPDGIKLRDGSTELASFTVNGSQIGQSTENHSVMNSTSWRMVDADKGDYAIIENLKSGTTATVQEMFISNPDIQYRETFTLYFDNPTVTGVTVDTIETSDYTVDGQDITVVSNNLYWGVPVIVTYTTTSDSIKAYMFGYRSKTPGVMSFGEGISEPTGIFSHSEGCNTESEGMYSHSEGKDTLASGDCSHAQNLGTVAAGMGQTVIGTYNIIDTTDRYLFIIGRGSAPANSSRGNALTVDRNGTVYFYAINSDDLTTAIINAGWESEVIE